MADEPVNIAEARKMIGRLAGVVWSGRTDGHLWSIPADTKRDWDFMLSAALDELEARRKADSALREQVQALPTIVIGRGRDDGHGPDDVYVLLDDVLALLAAPKEQ